MLQSLYFNDDGVLLQLNSLGRVEDNFTLLVGQVCRQDNLLLNSVENLV